MSSPNSSRAKIVTLGIALAIALFLLGMFAGYLATDKSSKSTVIVMAPNGSQITEPLLQEVASTALAHGLGVSQQQLSLKHILYRGRGTELSQDDLPQELEYATFLFLNTSTQLQHYVNIQPSISDSFIVEHYSAK